MACAFWEAIYGKISRRTIGDMSYSIRRATFFTLIATFAGVLGGFLFIYDWRESLPLAIFYALLVINTYPSVRLFSSLIPLDHGKHALADISLAGLYFFLAASLGNPQQFALCGLVLFMVAAGKYSLMFYDIPHQHLLERKVRVDLLGALMCACVLAAMNAGWILSAAWVMAVVFALANVYVLALKPIYRL